MEEYRQQKTLVGKGFLLPFVLVTSLFFLWGFAHAILDVFNKHFQEVLVISKTHSAMVQATMYSGYFIMAIPAGLYINRYGYRNGVVFGLLLYGIGALMFVPGEYMMSFNFFLFSLFVIGCGLVFLETAANPYVASLGDKETAASRLNLAQSFNGLGCICGPLLGGALLFGEDAHIALPYLIMGVVVLTVAGVFTRLKLPEIQQEEMSSAGTVKRSMWSHSRFTLGILALFAYEIAEISINSFFINYVTDDGLFDKVTAAQVLAFGGLGLFMLARVLGSWIMSKVKSESYLLFCAVGTLIATGLIVLNLETISLVCLFLTYAFEAIMFPTIFAIALKGMGEYTKRASSFLMLSVVGGAVGPLMMGLLADYTSMSFSFIVPFIAFCIVFLYAVHVKYLKN